MVKYFYYYRDTPIGAITILANENSIIGIDFGIVRQTNSLEKMTPVVEQCICELDEYFNKKRKKFDVKIELFGTDFQKKVWNALMTIPYGKTCSYGAIARAVGNSKAMRAVGSANGANPIPIIVPCHRVIASSGDIGGYSGGLAIKRTLMSIENITLKH